jgi:hypothetical protein
MKRAEKSIVNKALLFGAVALAATAMTSNANLILNGSFEDLGSGSFNSGGWNYFTSIPNWAPAAGTPDLEVGLGSSVYGVSGYAGNNVMELDARQNVTVDQIITTSKTPYLLSFLYAKRITGNKGEASLELEVYWNNVLLGLVQPTSGAMTLKTFNVTGWSPTSTLEFRGAGTSDSYGALIDDVRLVAVPETSTVVAGSLVLLPFGASIVRVLRRKQSAA